MFQRLMRFCLPAAAAVLVCGLSTPKAGADILIEPYVGYFMGKLKQTGSTLNVKGVGYGARLGYTKLGFMLGLDYMTGSFTDDHKPSSHDITPTNIGAFVGYQLPVMLRAYAAYNFSSRAKITNVNPNYTSVGSGFKLGVGFTALPLVSINVEYMIASFDKDGDGNTISPKEDNNMLGLTVSLPFEI